jgi:hypothetical protein
LISSGTPCPSTECATGVCDNNTHECVYTPKAGSQGIACARPPLLQCVALGSGFCQGTECTYFRADDGQACVPDVVQSNPCKSKATGTCQHEGFQIFGPTECVPEDLPDGTDCRPADGGDYCQSYHCFHGECRTSQTVVCPAAPSGCSAGVCDPPSGRCVYGPYPNGTRLCNDSSHCCPGQECSFPPQCTQAVFCATKYCYSSTILP